MNRDNCGIFSNKSGIINKISPKYQIRPQYDPKAGKFIHSEMIKRINKPIANKFVLYLKLHQGGWLLPKAMRYHGHLVELACYKDPLKKQWRLCVGAKKICSMAAARTRQVEGCQKY